MSNPDEEIDQLSFDADPVASPSPSPASSSATESAPVSDAAGGDRSPPPASARPAFSDAVDNPRSGPKSLPDAPERLKNAGERFGGSDSSATPGVNVQGIDQELAEAALGQGYTAEQLQVYAGNPEILRDILSQQNERLLRSQFQQPRQNWQQPQYQQPPMMPLGGQPQYQQPPMTPLGGPQYQQPGMPPAAGLPPPQYGQPPQQDQRNYFPGPQGFKPNWENAEAGDLPWDPRLVENFTGLQQHVEQQIANLQQHLAMVAQATFGQQQQAQEQARLENVHGKVSSYDQMLDSLGPDFEAIFGKGSYENFPAETPQGQARINVFRQFDFLQNHYSSQGLRPDPKRLLRDAARAVLGNQWSFVEQQAARRGTSNRVIGRAQSRTGRHVQGEAAAAAFADRFYRDRGFETSARDTEEADSML